MTERPVLKHEEGFLLPVASAMFDAIRPRMEDLLQEAEDQHLWERYILNRGRYLEREATSILAEAVPGSQHWEAIPWRSAADQGDIDGLVSADNLGLRIQCRAGRLSASARRGAPDRVRRDVERLISEAADQHRRLEDALANAAGEDLGLLLEQRAALDARFQLEVIVCLDDVTVWSAEAHRLRPYGALATGGSIPWVVSVLDLTVVCDLLQGASLVHYLLRRQRLERDGRIGAHDELDWVGHYMAEGLYFDTYFEGKHPPSHFRLLSYTDVIDEWYAWRAGLRTVETAKPAPRRPPNLEAFIALLERERPKDWIAATVALLNGNQESLDMWDLALGQLSERLLDPGWSNHTQLFEPQIGVTLYADRRVVWPEIRAAVADCIRQKMAQTGLRTWVAVGVGGDGPLFVLVFENDPNLRLLDVFVQPPARPQL